jgi:hypothetical protein
MSLKFRGDTLYGFGSNGLVPLELWQRRIVRLREPLVVETRAAFVEAVCPTSPLRQVGSSRTPTWAPSSHPRQAHAQSGSVAR